MLALEGSLTKSFMIDFCACRKVVLPIHPVFAACCFICRFPPLIVMLIHHRWARAASRALPLPVPETRLAFPTHAQRNAFRRDARQQSREERAIWIVDTHVKKLS